MKAALASLGFAALRQGVRPPELKFLKRYQEHWDFKVLLERLGVTLFLDVGANDGTLAKGVRRMGYQGRMVSFEPNPAEYQNVVALASSDPDWAVEWCAVGSVSGTASLNVTGSNSVLARC